MFNEYHGFHENKGFIDEKNAQLFSKKYWIIDQMISWRSKMQL